MDSCNLEVSAAYDAALRSAEIDRNSIRWLRRDTIRVCISGRLYHARLVEISIEGLRAALAKCLDEHCIITAVAAVATRKA